VGVEAGRDQHQLRPERLDARQQHLVPQRTEGVGAVPGREAAVEDVADAVLVLAAGVGIQGRLMTGGEQDPGFALEDRLRAVAVMDVEVGDGHALQPVDGKRMRRAHGHVVEQAKAHGAVRGGMVAGRAHRAEGAPTAGHHRVHRGGHGAGRPQRSFGRARRHRGVVVQPMDAIGRLGAEDAFDVCGGMHAAELRGCGTGRLDVVQCREAVAVQRLEHGGQPRRPLHVCRAGVVQQAGGMGIETQHGFVSPDAAVRRATAPRRDRSRGRARGRARTGGRTAG